MDDPERTSPAASAGPAAREPGFAEKMGEMLLPGGSFHGPNAEEELFQARGVMLLFYILYTLVILGTLVSLIFSGKIDVSKTYYKQEVLEAPSVAICPFNPKTAIVKPTNVSADALVSVTKYETDGEKKLTIKSYDCKYDRECVCANLYGVKFTDHTSAEVAGLGAMGDVSEEKQEFRERVEIRTKLEDPSKDKALKVGFYDSVDPMPQWFYMGQGKQVLGTLELSKWTVTDGTLGGLLVFLEIKALAKERHIFRYTSQEVGSEPESSVSYEMKNHFVDGTTSAESLFSVANLLGVIILLVIRSSMISVFTNLMFPKFEPKKETVMVREKSPLAETVISTLWCVCGWCPCMRRGERAPLMADT